MTDRQTIIGFAVTGALLVGLMCVGALLDGYSRDIVLNEGGIVESATVVGYLLCAAFILYKGGLAYVTRHPYLFLLIVFFMLRELDFDTRFTTTGIFKSTFFMSAKVPVVEKLAGGLVIGFLVYAAVSILYFHVSDFYLGLRSRSAISFGALIVFTFLLVANALDGIDRKLRVVGVQISERAYLHAGALEEILELGIPIVLLLTYSAYFKREEGRERGHSTHSTRKDCPRMAWWP